MDRPGAGFRLAGNCFVIAGLLLMALSGLRAGQQLGIVEYHNVNADGNVAGFADSGVVAIAFRSEKGEDVVFEHNTILSVLSYVPPYAEGDPVLVAYRDGNAVDATIIDQREWFGIAFVAAFGLLVLVWGLLIGRFGPWGGFAGLAAFLAVGATGNAAAAAVIQYFGY